MPPRLPPLSRRERQIMDILYARVDAGGSSVSDILANLPDPPSYSAVRALLRILENKGHARHKESANKYLYEPIMPHKEAAKSALQRLLETFFGGSIENALSTHLADPKTRLSPEELKRLSALIQQARQRDKA